VSTLVTEPAIALANTAMPSDELATPADLGRWLEGRDPASAPAPAEVTLRLSDFRALREAIRSLFDALVAGRAVPAEAAEAVNAASAAVRSARALDLTDPRSPAAVDDGAGGSRAAEELAAIARSAIDVVGTPERDRLRVCAAPRCGRYFRSTRSSRRWCSDACGNRARVARHHARQRAGTRRNTGPESDST
jgi:predicted RNA-binding Zn ribbon-like protein